jgi:hypothetical protein
VGLVRLIGARQWGPQTLSEQTRTELALFATGQHGLDATAAESLATTTDNAQLAAPSLGDKPLIVLAAGESIAPIPRWPEARRRQAAMSTNGRLNVGTCGEEGKALALAQALKAQGERGHVG